VKFGDQESPVVETIRQLGQDLILHTQQRIPRGLVNIFEMTRQKYKI